MPDFPSAAARQGPPPVNADHRDNSARGRQGRPGGSCSRLSALQARVGKKKDGMGERCSLQKALSGCVLVCRFLAFWRSLFLSLLCSCDVCTTTTYFTAGRLACKRAHTHTHRHTAEASSPLVVLGFTTYYTQQCRDESTTLHGGKRVPQIRGTCDTKVKHFEVLLAVRPFETRYPTTTWKAKDQIGQITHYCCCTRHYNKTKQVGGEMRRSEK